MGLSLSAHINQICMELLARELEDVKCHGIDYFPRTCEFGIGVYLIDSKFWARFMFESLPHDPRGFYEMFFSIIKDIKSYRNKLWC